MKFYRFRSLANLLGKYKELENQEIYFASPSEQNDPMEGYHEVYFQGDEIVWTNFFKNYLFLLDQVVQDIYLSEPRKRYKGPDHLGLFYVWDDLPSKLQMHLTKIFDSFLSIEYINKLILNLSKNERKFSWQDINYYLRSIHLIAISTINEIYYQINAPIFNTLNINLDCINQLNEEYFSLRDQLSEEQRPLLFQGVNLINEQLDLIHKLTLKKLTSKKQFLLQKFPYFFLEKVDLFHKSKNDHLFD